VKNIELQHNFVDACYYGDLRKAGSLLRGGARPNEPDDRSYYPLHMACQEGHFGIVRLLHRNGANLNLREGEADGNTALFSAVCGGHTRIVKYLITNGCHINTRRGGSPGHTPLHLASAWGQSEQVMLLVNAGAEINALDNEKWPPIYHAVFNGHSKTVALLAKMKALAESKASFKKLLTDIAIANKDEKTLRVLKRYIG
jgi:ankyrin repeat protein